MPVLIPYYWIVVKINLQTKHLERCFTGSAQKKVFFLGKRLVSCEGCVQFCNCFLLNLPFRYGGVLLVVTEEWDRRRNDLLGKADWIMLFIEIGGYCPKSWWIGSLFLISYQQWRFALISQTMPCHFMPLCHCTFRSCRLQFPFSSCPLVKTLILLFEIWLRLFFLWLLQVAFVSPPPELLSLCLGSNHSARHMMGI